MKRLKVLMKEDARLKKIVADLPHQELLRREGWQVNRKRVHRLWKLDGPKVPQKQRKRRRLGSTDNGVVRRRPEYLHHV